MHDGAKSLTTRKTVNLRTASKQSKRFIHPNNRPKMNLPYLTLIWDVLSCVVRRHPANVIQFEQFICMGWVEGYKASYLYAERGFDV